MGLKRKGMYMNKKSVLAACLMLLSSCEASKAKYDDHPRSEWMQLSREYLEEKYGSTTGTVYGVHYNIRASLEVCIGLEEQWESSGVKSVLTDYTDCLNLDYGSVVSYVNENFYSVKHNHTYSKSTTLETLDKTCHFTLDLGYISENGLWITFEE